MTQRKAQVLFCVAFLLGSAMTGGLAWHLSNERVWNARFEERERDLKILFSRFDDCGDIPACEDLYRQAYFELRSDQQLRDGRDALERIYKERPHLRPKAAE